MLTFVKPRQVFSLTAKTDIVRICKTFDPLHIFSSPLFFPFTSLLLHFMCFSFIECTALRIWISRFFKGSYRGANTTTLRHSMTSNTTVGTYVRTIYLTELVHERDIELRSHTWRQTDDASDRLRKFRSLCIYTRFCGLATSERCRGGRRGRRGRRRNYTCECPRGIFRSWSTEKGGSAPRSRVGWSTWHRRIRIINPFAESPWLFRGRYSPRYDFIVCEICR